MVHAADVFRIAMLCTNVYLNFYLKKLTYMNLFDDGLTYRVFCISDLLSDWQHPHNVCLNKLGLSNQQQIARDSLPSMMHDDVI